MAQEVAATKTKRVHMRFNMSGLLGANHTWIPLFALGGQGLQI